MRALPVILFAISSPVFAADSDALLGNWKLVSWQVIVENEPPQNVFGPNPKGYLILTREGRSIVVTNSRQPERGNGRRRAGGHAQVDTCIHREISPRGQ